MLQRDDVESFIICVATQILIVPSLKLALQISGSHLWIAQPKLVPQELFDISVQSLQLVLKHHGLVFDKPMLQIIT
jgi:hypothetical protein